MQIDLKELKNITLLYVEDEEIIRSQTVSIFNNLFKKTYVAKNGQEGFNIFKQHQNEIDTVVSDINMPELSGLEMAEEIHKLVSNIPIIITTAYTDEEFLLKSLELNIAKYITKPLKIKELTYNIVQVVKKYRNQKQLSQQTQTLVKQQKKAQQEVITLQKSVSYNKQEIAIQTYIINEYISYIKLDNNGIIQDVSNKFCTLYGYSKEEIINQPIKVISNNHALIQKKLLTAIREKKTITFKDNFTTKQQQTIEFYCTLYPLYENEDGLVSGYSLYQDPTILH